jgi:hypothetical protein
VVPAGLSRDSSLSTVIYRFARYLPHLLIYRGNVPFDNGVLTILKTYGFLLLS